MEFTPTNPSLDCVRTNNAGFPYEEFSCLYANSLGKTYTTLELKYDPVPVRDYMTDHPYIPIVACLLYGLWCIFGRIYFKTRNAWSWRRLLSLWNFSLALFSGIAFVRTAPHLFHNLTHLTLEEIFCNDPESSYGSGTTGLWVQFFVLSKFPELFDTFFIVIHKKPLIFLHWYHHVTVLLYCWHSYVSKAPYGLFFIVMNYGVHSIMYFYYFLMAVKAKPKWMNAIVITVAQISQMIVGVMVTLFGLYYYYYSKTNNNNTSSCMITKENNIAGLLMYGSYLLLFLQFFVGRYLQVKAKKQTSTSRKSNGVAAIIKGKKQK